MEKLKVLDLFSGIGGFSLGLERTGGFETVGFCEIEPFCQQVLRKHWPDVPIYEDVRELHHEGPVDVITGGYPCQPFSTAGQRKGAADDRHLWPAMFDCIKKHKPSWVIGENVAGHISMGLDDVLSDLESEGYACRAFIIPACALGAAHRRDRLWIVAHTSGIGASRLQRQLEKPSQSGQGGKDNALNSKRVHADTNSIRQSGQGWAEEPSNQKATGEGEADQLVNALGWPTVPAVRGRNDGVSRKLDKNRLKALGNAVVPQIPKMIGHAILEAERQYND